MGNNYIKIIIIKLIEKYQFHGGGKALIGIDCNFSPTCSEYMKICIKEFGVIIGLFKGIKRIFRCNDKDTIHTVIDKPIN